MAWQGAPAEPEKPARGKRANPRKAKTAKAAEGLMNALAFVKKATNEDGVEGASHVKISNNMLVAYDGVKLSAGHPIEEDMTACPHYKRMSDALKNVGSKLSMSLSDGGRITIAGEHAKYVVPCIPPESMPPVFPDAPIAVIDDRIKDGFREVGKLAKEEAEKVYEMSVLLRAGSMVGCNGALALEYWHGIDLPPNLAIPFKAAKMIAEQSAKLERFGFTWGRSATFWFEGGGWIRTQLFGEEWPDMNSILNCEAYPQEVPGLFEALDRISSFSEDGAIHFHEDKLKTTYAASDDNGPVYGASYDLPGLKAGTHCSARLLSLARIAAERLDYTTHADRIVFANNEGNMRGVLMKMRG